MTLGDSIKSASHVGQAIVSSAARTVDKGKIKQTERGRISDRLPRLTNPFERAESRKRNDKATVEVDVHSMKPRLRRSSAVFDDPSDPRATFGDFLLEPCPHDPICNSVSEIIGSTQRRVQSGIDTLEPMAGSRHTDSKEFFGMENTISTSAGIQKVPFKNCGPLCITPALSPEINSQLLADTSQSPDRATQSSNKLRLSTTLAPSASSQLPQEIMHHMYLNLGPVDFNSARHTCRWWYISSLERSSLETMLRRGGWSNGIQHDRVSNPFNGTQVPVNDEWLMSKRLCRECALGPDWTGNGLDRKEIIPRLDICKDHFNKTPFLHTSTTDFTNAGVQYLAANENSSGMSFTVSSCGKFLMVANGCLVYIYELNRSHEDELSEDIQSGDLRPVSAVICPRRVLACSMDTSSHHYAIAVLMDGRMGLVCDLTSIKVRLRRTSSLRSYSLQGVPILTGNGYRNRVSITSSRPCGGHRTPHEQRFVFPIIAAENSQTGSGPESEQHLSGDLTYSVRPPASVRPPGQFMGAFSMSLSKLYSTDLPESPNLPSHCPMSIETSTPTLYAPLCTADDPPRSIALCPQRRCVAFGCSSGIELHWVDALTGQDLNRWFPLTAPSDYLYFLPPRAGVDSAKKLRLISSAGRPGERSVMADKFGAKRNGAKIGEKLHPSPFWNVVTGYNAGWRDYGAFDSRQTRTMNRDDSDHYRAVPLSDGYHILFTDPATGLLCLGTDAPIGGPIKLLRKIWFAGPQGQGSPVAYTAGSDLKWGVRVVAAYGQGAEQSIWLFSVPSDVFANTQNGEGYSGGLFLGISSRTKSGNRDWLKWWCNASLHEWLEPDQSPTHAMTVRKDKVWPLQVRGQHIGSCRGLVDIAVDGAPDMAIWAFGKEGTAKTWQIDCGKFTSTKRFTIMRDGTVRAYGDNNDMEMPDAPPQLVESLVTVASEGQDTFDGTASMANSSIFWKEHVRYGGVGPSQAVINYDVDGDVLMADLVEEGMCGQHSNDGAEAFKLAHDRQEIRHYHRGFSEQFYNDLPDDDGLDLIDVLTGIARIDIEVR